MVYSAFPVFFNLFPNMTVDTGHGGGGETHNMTPPQKYEKTIKEGGPANHLISSPVHCHNEGS